MNDVNRNFNKAQMLRLFDAGAMIQDRSSEYLSSDEDGEGAYPVYLQGVRIGHVSEDIIVFLEENLDTQHPTFVRDTLATARGIDRYWFHKDNQEAALLAVEVSYQHPGMAHLPVVLNLEGLSDIDTSEFGYNVLQAVFDDGSYETASDDDDDLDRYTDEEDDEETDDEDEEDAEEEVGLGDEELEWVVHCFYRGDDKTAPPRTIPVMALTAEDAENKLLDMSPPGTEIPKSTEYKTRLVTTDDIPEDEEEEED